MQIRREASSESLSDPAGRNGIRTGLVRVRERHTVVLRGHAQLTLAATVTIDRLINDERINNGHRLAEGFQPVSQGFLAQDRQVIRCVVNHNR